MNKLRKIYMEIKTPEELLEFMSNNIQYGYITKTGETYVYTDNNFEKNFNQYVLQNNSQVIDSKVGICWDQVELERDFFLKMDYEVKTFFIMINVDYKNSYPTHTYLAYKDKNDSKWVWFENSDYANRGIHKFNSLEELINCQKEIQSKMYLNLGLDVKDLNKIIVNEYKKPTDNLNLSEYLEWVLK